MHLLLQRVVGAQLMLGGQERLGEGLIALTEYSQCPVLSELTSKKISNIPLLSLGEATTG